MDQGKEPLVFLDACCLINLFATDRAEEILRSLPYRFAIARYVATEEVLTVGSEGQDQHPRITSLIDQGNLEEFAVCTAEEHRELVRFALQLDDGEAHTCALAVVHGGRVATDDRKAIRVLSSVLEEREEEPCLRTSQLLFQWAEQEAVSVRELARLLAAITRRASFLPPRTDPNFQWWMERIADDPG